MAHGDIMRISPEESLTLKRQNTYQRIAGAVSRALVRMKSSREEPEVSPRSKEEKMRALASEKSTACTIIDYHGDDSAIAAPSFHVVSDGVSGTMASSAPLARSLVVNVGTELAQINRKFRRSAKVPVKVFREAVARGVVKTQEKFGDCEPTSCMQATLTVAYIDKQSNTLLTLCVGDSKAIVVRKKNDGSPLIAYESTAVLSDFNAPVVVSTNSATDGFTCAKVDEFELDKGDIVMTFSDGVGDNMFADEIAVNAMKFASGGPEAISNGIADLAKDYSMMTGPENPWVLGASEAYYARAKSVYQANPCERSLQVLEDAKQKYYRLISQIGNRAYLSKEFYPRGMRNRYTLDQLRLCASHGRGKLDDISIAVTVVA